MDSGHAVEAQASDRGHRIDQGKPVIVYRLIGAGTVEQHSEAGKAELTNAIFEGGGTRDRLSFTLEGIDTQFATK